MQFVMPSVGKWIAIVLSLAIGVAAFLLRKRIPEPVKGTENFKSTKRKRTYLMVAGVLALWFFLGLVFGSVHLGTRSFEVAISPTRMHILGITVSSTVFSAWIVVAVLSLTAIVLRYTVIPRFTEVPHGIQLMLETAIGAIDKLTKEKYGRDNPGLSSYFFSLAALLLGSAFVELFGVRPPTTDLSMTLSYALVTFVLINYYGIRRKGIYGRLQSLVKPNPIIAPFKLLSDLAVPISLACRLFGNMLGGMIVVELIYYALGAFSVGVPALLGIYFNAFHPLIQYFIFINLSLTFIGEAVEVVEDTE